MIQQEDSEERRDLARQLFLVSTGLLDLQAINHAFRTFRGEVRRTDEPGRTIFRVFVRRKHVDTFIFEELEPAPAEQEPRSTWNS